MKIMTRIIALFLSSYGSCYAQGQEQLSPRELKQKTIVTEPQTLYKGFFRAGLGLSYGVVNNIFSETGKRVPIDNNARVSSGFIQLGMIYGVTNRLQIEVAYPYNFGEIKQSVRYEVPEADQVGALKWRGVTSGFGDLNINAAYQIIRDTDSHPSTTLFVYTTLPTGEKNPTDVKNEREYNRPTGEGEASVEMQLRLRKVRFPYAYSFFGGYRVNFGGEKMNMFTPLDPTEYSFKSGNSVDVGGYFHFHLNEWLAVRNTLEVFFFGPDEFDGEKEEESTWALFYYPGLSFQLKGFRIDQAVTMPIAGKLGGADPSFILLLQYTF